MSSTKWLRSSENHLFPHLGTLPLNGIKAPAPLAVMKKAEAKGILSAAQDLPSMAGQLFRYGVQTGRCERFNPRKAGLYRWRETVAERLQGRGDANTVRPSTNTVADF